MAIPSHLPSAAGDAARWAPSPAERFRRTTVTPMQRSPAESSPTHGSLEALDPLLRDAMLAAAPRLRRSAMALSGRADRADDLVQETLLRAMVAIGSFRPGSNMAAWMTTILRNLYRSEQRKRWREVEDPEGRHLASLVSSPAQEGCMALEEVRMALGKVPSIQREALILVGAFGFTYAEAGAACGAATGTVKSRVHRARTQLAGLLRLESAAGPGQA